MIAGLLSAFFIAIIPFFFDTAYNIMIDLLNFLIAALAPAAVAIIGIFPPNPCGSLIAACTDVISALPTPEPTLLLQCLQTLAWLLPIQYLVNLVGCAMFTVMIYFTIAPIARWLKLIT